MERTLLLLGLVIVAGCVWDGGSPPPAQTSSTQPAGTPASSTAAAPDSSAGSEDVVAYVPEEETTSTVLPVSASSTTLSPLIRTFIDAGGPVCSVAGRPVVRMYGKSDCDHCIWAGPAFDRVVGEYAGRIEAHHWVFDRYDDALTPQPEGAIPDGEYLEFTRSNRSTVPYYSFGCRFVRTGNGYYVRNRLDLEEAEFGAVIEQILAQG
jgi:hypothetical protein